MKTDESKVIRNIEALNLSKKSEILAQKLIEKIDMPVVFEINSQKDKNYGARHGLYHNQFWLIVKPQSEDSEYERIILSNLYRGIQERRRVLHPAISETYKNTLLKLTPKDVREKRIKISRELIGRIGALATTIDAELFLSEYGIATSNRTKRIQFENRKFLLNDYLAKQKRLVKLCWFPELEWHNIIDYSRIAWWNKEYHKELARLLGMTYPKTKAKWYVDTLNRMVEMLHIIYNRYKEKTEFDVISWFLKETVDIVGLHGVVDLTPQYAMKSEYAFKNGIKAPVYSFVPEGIENEESFIKAFRHINEGILLLQEYYHYVEEKEMPDAHVNLVLTDFCEACADGNLQKGYFISFTTGLIKNLEEKTRTVDINSLGLEKFVEILGEDEVRSRLYRYMLYYITAHEYAHILNSDCDLTEKSRNSTREQKEILADEQAYKMMKNILYTQYRCEQSDILVEIKRIYTNVISDQKIFGIAAKWSKDSLRNFENFQ